MKRGFTNKTRFFFFLIFVVSLIQSIVVLSRIGAEERSLAIRPERADSVFTVYSQHLDDVTSRCHDDIEHTVFISLGTQLILLIFFFFYHNIMLRESFNDINAAVGEFAKGQYGRHPAFDKIIERNDKVFGEVLEKLDHARDYIVKFDYAKKKKIVENKNRILGMMNLSDNGFIIIAMNGSIPFVNDNVAKYFPSITENGNIVETAYPPEIQNTIIKYILGILRTKMNQPPQQVFFHHLKRHILLKSSVVRDKDGNATGAVIAFLNLTEKKKEGKKDNK
ncbi:MAG: hypothetical protein CSB55_08395 [Candidatus Cloacimonadota bacterium]|nr:MAG: hypothetical protein CSB55_08395 [Candidatus Cloacimonadota bacterium]